ncbi:septum formation family protein [Micromonospora sp. RTGN7]|uniref:septum formation family protein n=1 Tax=Micromonospora sp. RTGN7 TaxID=3016526 RepID=UPI0029FF1D30|nr:septum formation family protein [Micromonospora sp. RTGN7]
MRYRLGSAALGLLLATVLAGCDTAGSTDSAPAEGKSPAPTAGPFVPEAGVCHPAVETVGYRSSYTTVDCAKTHFTETVHVGVFTGADADRFNSPPPGTREARAAFHVCDTQATAFVGADWRGGLMSVQVVVPEPKDWTGGSRWYRCDLFTLAPIDSDTAADHAVERAGTLRGGLSRPSPLAHGCFTDDKYENLLPAPCTKRHRFEYVGVWTAPDGAYKTADRDADVVHMHCRSVVTAYTKGTPSAKSAQGTGTTYRLPSPKAWERGDRGIRCFYWSGDRDMTRSLKG